MDISKLPIEQQRQWLIQRGWAPHQSRENVWIDPDTRMPFFIAVAVKRAMEGCRIESDLELKPAPVERKDDAPWPDKIGPR